ncbi:hypothetical protein EYZ11_009534 [Aspergillus tanneri]|uniref:RNA-dependent RNA polymerase n=1 Tax=Aspergillus tanneri TaxID=1220188 RepID=A0A4V3UNF7_9EURO|nr:hypothetical protein EYZ11_009534 [Aspergillus tanneri]
MPPQNRAIPAKSSARQCKNTSQQQPPQILAPWRFWDSVAVNISNVPNEATTFDLWQAFQKEGHVFSIDLFEDFHGKREPKGRIRFKPPPGTDFWTKGKYTIKLPNKKIFTITVALSTKRPDLRIPSPTNPDVHYPAEVKIPISSMDIGVLFDEVTLLPMRTIGSGRNEQAFVVLDVRNRTLITCIVHNPQELSSLPVSLRKKNPVIDIGRWNAFKIKYSENIGRGTEFTLLHNILEDYNVRIVNTDRFTQWDEHKERMPPVWKWIDLSDTQMPKAPVSSLEELIDPNYIHLPFPVRYQLEVCLSNGYLYEYTMARGFVIKLSELGEGQSIKLLEHVAAKKQVYYDPMKIFDLKFVRGATDVKTSPYCCYMRSARITPSTIYFNTPTVEISNRIIRHYIEHADRFLRVRFTDEKLFGRINSTVDNTMDEVFTRIKRALANGIVIGDRRYEFLAFGNSQLREHGAYFFAPLPNLTAANIRAWMGHFNDIRNVAKHAARLGQCFSTTRAISGCPVHVRHIDDIKRNGYTFSDGVGRISRFLAQMAMSELKIKTPTGDPPSAFQFRLGGCKGMLTVSQEAQRHEVHIRKSQYKFPAIHSGLEIIRWSQFSIAALNRQLIIVLSTLGISDEIFLAKLKTMLQGLDEALESDTRAIYWLKKYVDPNQMTIVVSQMIHDGFRRAKEPFITSILCLWRAWHLKYLKEKAKIAIDKGASLLGCMDETGTLNGYYAHKIPGNDATLDEHIAALPEIFLQTSRPDNGGRYEIIEGICILARNPSLHPGDIRVVRAVNAPQLAHLHDVVVLPQTGDRDVASMCSGGDLDGDDYLVIWDQDLIPDDWFRAPMKYTSNKARDLDHDVTVDEITSFFVTYMKNDCLPKIAHAHLAWADRLLDGVNEEKCIRLAQLHSDAVDYNKTGIPAHMTRNLEPHSWPHFMEKIHKPKEKIYHSRKILGQLYDAVERVDFIPSLENPFDQRILGCQLVVHEELYDFSRELKSQYDSAMRRIMAQHEIKTEFEVWSTFVLSHSNMSKDYKFHEEIGSISSSLSESFRKQCYNKVGGRNFEQLAPLAVAMYRITHEEMTTALEKYRNENMNGDKMFVNSVSKMEKLPLISFPWVLSHVLGKIAMGYYELSEHTSTVHELYQNSHNSSLNRHPSQTENQPSIGHSNREDPFEQLVDFGLSEAQMPSSSSLSSPPIEGNINLLDFNTDPVDSGRAGSEAAPKIETTFNSVIEAGSDCDEIVEEDDHEPTALDKLNMILNA